MRKIGWGKKHDSRSIEELNPLLQFLPTNREGGAQPGDGFRKFAIRQFFCLFTSLLRIRGWE